MDLMYFAFADICEYLGELDTSLWLYFVRKFTKMLKSKTFYSKVDYQLEFLRFNLNFAEMLKTMKRTILLFSACTLVFGSFGQEEFENEHSFYKKGQYLGVSIPLKDLPASDQKEEMAKDHAIRQERVRPADVNPNALPQGNDPIIQDNYGTEINKALIKNWDGQTGAFPPDPSGAAGPNHYVQAVNTKYRVYDKNGSPLTASLNLSSLWAGSSNDGDPIVMYDRHADRWVITQFQISGNKILFAISTTPDPTGTYYTYSFTMPTFPDYPKYSIWSDGYYMTSNTNNKNAVVYERAKMLVGDPTAAMVGITMPSFTTHYGFKSVLPADADGDLPPYGTPNYMFYFQDDSWSGVPQDCIKILKFQVNWTTPASSSITLHQTLYPSAFNSVFTTNWNDIVQKNSTQKLDAISSIFNYRAQYLRWPGYNSVTLCHVTDVNNANLGGIRWYELRQDEGTAQFSVYQEGTYAPADGDSRFVGSIAMDENKNIGLAYSISGVNSFPSLGFTGRYSTMPLGEMSMMEEIAIAGSSAQSGGNRFGDYAHLTLDPNGTTFWFTGEYIGNSGSRRTRIFSFDLTAMASAPQNQLNQASMVAFVNDGTLTINLEGLQYAETMMIDLFDMNGKALRSGSGKMADGKLTHQFNVNGLPSATYMVRVGNTDVQRIEKIVIQ